MRGSDRRRCGELTFFPADGDEGERCVAGAYEAPDVAMTELPSAAFGEAIAGIEAEDWRGGTPTRFVVEMRPTPCPTYTPSPRRAARTRRS